LVDTAAALAAGLGAAAFTTTAGARVPAAQRPNGLVVVVDLLQSTGVVEKVNVLPPDPACAIRGGSNRQKEAAAARVIRRMWCVEKRKRTEERERPTE
jgi:hypothetical protein